MKKKTLQQTLVILSIALLLLLAACTSPPPTEEPIPSAEEPSLTGEIIIFHAGSLTVPVDELAKAFQAKHPDVTFLTEGAGSRTTARKVSELGLEADLVMSADYTVIDELLIPDFADWNIRFARNTMVIAFTEDSLYADEINSDNWYEILTREGVIYGHSEPNADPCGYRTLMVWQLAEKHYEEPGLYEILDASCPEENVRPKSVELIALLQSGDMDYAFEYRSVAVQHSLEFIELPEEINLSMVEQADFYSQAQVELDGAEPGETITKAGKPIVYGVTMPTNAPHPQLALEFVKFLLSAEGQVILQGQGQPPIIPPVTDDVENLPDELKMLVESAAGASEPAGDTVLTFTGKVENVLTLSRADLEGMDVIELTTEHPKKGEQTYTGVLLSTLLEQAKPSDDTTLSIIASDAYTVDISISDIRACADCMIAFDGDILRMVMPGMESNFWVKDVVCIEIK